MRLSCKESSRLISQGLDRKLGLGERVALRLHLLFCDACTNLNAQLALLRRAMGRLKDGEGSVRRKG